MVKNSDRCADPPWPFFYLESLPRHSGGSTALYIRIIVLPLSELESKRPE